MTSILFLLLDQSNKNYCNNCDNSNNNNNTEHCNHHHHHHHHRDHQHSNHHHHNHHRCQHQNQSNIAQTKLIRIHWSILTLISMMMMMVTIVVLRNCGCYCLTEFDDDDDDDNHRFERNNPPPLFVYDRERIEMTNEERLIMDIAMTTTNPMIRRTIIDAVVMKLLHHNNNQWRAIDSFDSMKRNESESMNNNYDDFNTTVMFKEFISNNEQDNDRNDIDSDVDNNRNDNHNENNKNNNNQNYNENHNSRREDSFEKIHHQNCFDGYFQTNRQRQQQKQQQQQQQQNYSAFLQRLPSKIFSMKKTREVSNLFEESGQQTDQFDLFEQIDSNLSPNRSNQIRTMKNERNESKLINSIMTSFSNIMDENDDVGVENSLLDNFFQNLSRIRSNSNDVEILERNGPDIAFIKFRDNSRFWVQRVLVPIIMIIGIIGNTITIIIMTRRRMRSSTNWYLAALAIFDMIYLKFTFILSLKHYPNAHSLDFYYYWYLFPLFTMITDASSNTSVWLTVTFTIERYIAVCHPIKGKVICTESRAKRVIFCVFIVCLSITLPTPFEWVVIERIDNETQTTVLEAVFSDLGNNETYRNIYYHLTVFLFVLFPLILLVIFNSFLIRSVHISNKQRSRMVMGKDRYNRRTSRSLSIGQQTQQKQVPTIDEKQLDTINVSDSQSIKTNARNNLLRHHHFHLHHHQQQQQKNLNEKIFSSSSPPSSSLLIAASNNPSESFVATESSSLASTTVTPSSNPVSVSALSSTSAAAAAAASTTSSSSSSTSRQEIRITVMLIAVVILFIMCQTPTACILVYTAFHQYDPQSNEGCLLVGLSNIFNLLMSINSAGNFVLYCLLSQKYRRTFSQMFCPCLARKFHLHRHRHHHHHPHHPQHDRKNSYSDCHPSPSRSPTTQSSKDVLRLGRKFVKRTNFETNDPNNQCSLCDRLEHSATTNNTATTTTTTTTTMASAITNDHHEEKNHHHLHHHHHHHHDQELGPSYLDPQHPDRNTSSIINDDDNGDEKHRQLEEEHHSIETMSVKE